MKKLFFAFTGIFFYTLSFAQASFGPKAGLNVADLKVHKEPDGNKPRIGAYAGGLMQADLSEKFMLQPELLYSMKGHRSAATQFNGKGTISLHYVTIPVLVGYRATENLSILLGPEAGFLIKAQSAYDENNVDITKNFKEFDLGINLGLAYRLTNNLGADLRYTYGFEGLFNVMFTDQQGSITGTGKAGANRVLQLGIFYRLSKKG